MISISRGSVSIGRHLVAKAPEGRAGHGLELQQCVEGQLPLPAADLGRRDRLRDLLDRQMAGPVDREILLVEAQHGRIESEPQERADPSQFGLRLDGESEA